MPIQKRWHWNNWKKLKRARKLLICLKHLSYSERLKQLQLPTLKYRRLCSDMIQVFKMVHKCYDVCAAVKLNFNTLSTTRRNKYKLQKSASHYNLRKFSFCSWVVNIWNSLPDSVVDADMLNTFKSRLDKPWLDQDVLYNFHSELTGTGGASICSSSSFFNHNFVNCKATSIL